MPVNSARSYLMSAGSASVLLLALVSGAQAAEETEQKEKQLETVTVSAEQVYPGSPDDVVRTGSKTDTPLRDIPASVAVVPAEILREQGAVTMNDAMRNVSSVQPLMAGGYGFADNYTARGLPLTFLRDDMLDGTTQNGYFRTMYDVERIEVLKGPGSALFGAAGPGGTINVITKKPQEIFNIEGGVTAGNFDTLNGYIDATGEITDGVSGRLIADTERMDGFRDLDRDIKEISPSVLWEISDEQSLLVDFDHREIEITPDNYGILFDQRANIADVPDETEYYSPFNTTDQDIDRLAITHNIEFSQALNMRTALTHQERELYIVRNAGGNAGNLANASTGRNSREQSDGASYDAVQNELIVTGETGPVAHTLLVGVEYSASEADTYRSDRKLPNITDIFNPVVPEQSLYVYPATPSFDREITSNTTSFYLQDEIAFGEQWKLRLGARNDQIDYKDDGASIVNGVYQYRVVDQSEALMSDSVGLVYQPNKLLAFYVGYNEGAFVNLGTESTILANDPETSQQHEVGVKMSAPNGKADMNLAVFKTKREDYFITLFGATSPTQDGNDESRGVEVNFGLHPLDGWDITVNAAHIDAETLSDNVASNTTLGIINESVYGKIPTGVSKELYSLWSNYRFQNGFAKGLSLGLGATHKGSSFADSLNLYKVPSYTVFDAAASYTIDEWELALNIKNITDETYYMNPTFSGALPGDPFGVYTTVRFNFN